MNVSKPFIQFVYCSRVFTSASGSACAEKVAFVLQYVLHPSHPFPVSQASKNFWATLVIDVMALSFEDGWNVPSARRQLASAVGPKQRRCASVRYQFKRPF